MKHKLLIKTHNITGLKYLCYTRKNNINSYLGSGKEWKKHLKKYGNNISTQLIFETNSKKKFIDFSTKKSKELNIVNSKEWSNLKLEAGDGGDTVSDKIWINNGKEERYCLKTNKIPDGWTKGRGPKCVFKNSEFQKELNKRVDRTTIGLKIKAGQQKSEKFKNRKLPDISGDKNPLANPKIRKKHKLSNNTPEIKKLRSINMKKNKPWLYRYNDTHQIRYN
jgi:hypothetical protein